MEFNLKNLIRESLSVLLEGRLEDVKAKYSNIEGSEIVIDNLSQGDPSGNNKYLDWMAKVSLQDKADTAHIVATVTEFHNNFSRLNSEFTTPIVDSNKQMFPGRAENRVKNNPKDINSYPTLESLRLIVNALEETKKERPDRDRIYQDDKWTVIVPKSHGAACKYGVHSNWCVSTSNSQYFDRYTKEKDALLFFIIWRNKRVDTDKTEYKIAINAEYKRWDDPHRWDWYDMPDHTQDPNLMLNIFPSKMVETIQRYLVNDGKAKGKIVDEKNVKKLIDANMSQLVGKTESETFFLTNNIEAFQNLQGYRQAIRYYHSTEDINNGKYVISLSRSGEVGIETILWTGDQNNETLVNQYSNWVKYYTNDRSFFNHIYQIDDNAVPNPELKQTFDNRVKERLSTVGGMWVETRTTNLKVGDRVRFKKGRGYWDMRRNPWNETIIDRETNSGYLVTGVTDEFPKGRRFKPSNGTSMDVWHSFNGQINLEKH